MTKSPDRHELVESGCAFRFHDNDQVRSPFPARIQPQLKQNAEAAFMEWVRNLTKQDRKEVDDDELVGVFEMLLFNEALKLVGDEDPDLVLTIHYPFLPRIGDEVNDETHGPSRVVDRKLEQKEDKQLYMKLFLENQASRTPWETEILIPA
jgi:hypothetical protein